MPIKFSFRKLPVDADGKAYDSLEAFQAAELSKLLGINDDTDSTPDDIVSHKDEIMEILTLTMDARPAARGVPKKRKAKSQPELPPVFIEPAPPAELPIPQ